MSSRRLASFALAATASLPAGHARAEAGGLAAWPFGVRLRHGQPNSSTSAEAVVGTTMNAVLDKGASAALFVLGAIGSDGKAVTGTFASSLMMGPILGAAANQHRGLTLRTGFDVFVDSLGALKASYLSVPEIQFGYAYASDRVQLDFGLDTAPILAGRFRLDESVRRMGLGAKGGAYANLMLGPPGLTLHFSADHLLASTTSGGSANWVQGLACVSFGWIDVCGDGFAARFADKGPNVAMGYAGLSVGVNWLRAHWSSPYKSR